MFKEQMKAQELSISCMDINARYDLVLDAGPSRKFGCCVNRSWVQIDVYRGSGDSWVWDENSGILLSGKEFEALSKMFERRNY